MVVMQKTYSLGCYTWMTAVGWPGPESDLSCCFECHEGMAHIQTRFFLGFSYTVCCGVKTLCLKKLKHSVILKKYDDAKNMTLKEWMGLYVYISDSAVVPSTAADTDSYIIDTTGSSG